jgi:hypothetical protein
MVALVLLGGCSILDASYIVAAPDHETVVPERRYGLTEYRIGGQHDASTFDRTARDYCGQLGAPGRLNRVDYSGITAQAAFSCGTP